MYSESHRNDTAIRRLLEYLIKTSTVTVRVVGSDDESFDTCTDNEDTVRSLAQKYSTKAPIFLGWLLKFDWKIHDDGFAVLHLLMAANLL